MRSLRGEPAHNSLGEANKGELNASLFRCNASNSACSESKPPLILECSVLGIARRPVRASFGFSFLLKEGEPAAETERLVHRLVVAGAAAGFAVQEAVGAEADVVSSDESPAIRHSRTTKSDYRLGLWRKGGVERPASPAVGSLRFQAFDA